MIINDGETVNKTVTGLDKFTEYAFQVWAFTSVGDGRRSSVKHARTKEDGKKRAINDCKASLTCAFGRTILLFLEFQ